jgi:hypothetical protein
MTSRDSMNAYRGLEMIPDDYSNVKADLLLPGVKFTMRLIFLAEAEEFDVSAMLSW